MVEGMTRADRGIITGKSLPPDFSNITFGSWMGGDRDGIALLFVPASVDPLKLLNFSILTCRKSQRDGGGHTALLLLLPLDSS